MRLHVYDMGVVDFFTGMMTLKDYIKMCVKNDPGQDMDFYNVECGDYMKISELKQFLVKCFIAVKSHDTYWDGDVRGVSNIAISAIPRPTSDIPYKILVFKQDDNGHSFMVSECPMKACFETGEGVTHIIKLRNVTNEIILKWFTESYDLTEDLFRRGLAKDFPPKEDENNNDDVLNDFEKIT